MAIGGPDTPRLYLIADHEYCGDTERWLDLIDTAVEALPDRFPAALQLRAKELSGAARDAMLEAALDRLSNRPVPVFINGAGIDAASVRTRAVHWPESAIPTRPQPVPVGFRRAASIHSADAAWHAAVAGAEFGVFAPVFDPGSKPGSGRGVETLRELVEAVDLPILALGGVDTARVGECLQAGAAGVAVVSSVFGADDPGAAVRELAAALG
ncbi:MAG TPA: thiamine phosphate synthase [Acidobacteriota bacterium]|nr:thiamine phosphate synthase [Acidobacteriota bacterium]